MGKDIQALRKKINEVIKLFNESDIVNSPIETIELVRNHPTLPEADKAQLLEKLSNSNLMLIACIPTCACR